MKNGKRTEMQLTKHSFLTKKNPGFTLIEATVVLFIIGLLMLLILPNLSQQRENAKATHRQAMAATVQTQVDLYRNDHPDADNVSLDVLENENYLTHSQREKVDQLKIGIFGYEVRD